MILKIQSHLKKISFILIILTIALIPYLSAQGEGGRCWEAYKDCLMDAASLLPDFTSFYTFIGLCTAGYIFCKKYIES